MQTASRRSCASMPNRRRTGRCGCPKGTLPSPSTKWFAAQASSASGRLRFTTWATTTRSATWRSPRFRNAPRRSGLPNRLKGFSTTRPTRNLDCSGRSWPSLAYVMRRLADSGRRASKRTERCASSARATRKRSSLLATASRRKSNATAS